MNNINIVLTYRHQGNEIYPPMIDMVLGNVAKWGYKNCRSHIHDEHMPLMLWILEAQKAYLESDAFDCNSIFFSPDALIIKPIHDKFTGFDLGVTLNEQQKDIVALNNGVIFISPKNKDKLIKLWEDAIEIYRNYRPELQEWGGDQKALHDALKAADWKPYDLEVAKLPCADFNAPVSKSDPILDRNIIAQAHIIHFKGPRKSKMAQMWKELKGKIYG